MKTISNIIIASLLIGQINSYAQKEDGLAQKIDNFPMIVGSEWTYNRQEVIKYYESETSDNITHIDTVDFTFKVWIDKDTVLNDTMNVKVFMREPEIYSVLNEYKFIDNEGLKTYAYSYSIDTKAILETSNSKLIPVKQKSNGMVSEGIIFADKPELDIKLPLENNSTWTCKYLSEKNPFQIEKKVTGTETLILNGQSFVCFKIDWKYLDNPFLSGNKVTDWVSDKGLVKRLTIVDRLEMNVEGEPLHYIQSTEIITLKDLIIK